VRLLACGRYHHVKAIAYLPALQVWLFYDVKFNGTRLLLAREDDPGSRAFLPDHLDSCDLVAMPRLPIPKRVAPQAGFCCTLAMKHLLATRPAALRPDQLWRDSIAAGGQPYASDLAQDTSIAATALELLLDCVLSFMKAHAETSRNASTQQCRRDDAVFTRPRSQRLASLRARFLDKLSAQASGRNPTAPLHRAFDTTGLSRTGRVARRTLKRRSAFWLDAPPFH
jgi:hypothetical protein